MWEIDVGVLFQRCSGQSLLAFILERKRAVGITKNKAHKDFVLKKSVGGREVTRSGPMTRGRQSRSTSPHGKPCAQPQMQGRCPRPAESGGTGTA